MFPWRPEIASHRSGSVERSDDIDTRRSRHGRRFRRGNRPLAMSGRRGDIESRRPQAVVAIGSRLEKGQHVPTALQICDRRGESGETETDDATVARVVARIASERSAIIKGPYPIDGETLRYAPLPGPSRA